MSPTFLTLCLTIVSYSYAFSKQDYAANYVKLRKYGDYYNGPDAWKTELEPYLQPNDVGFNPLYNDYPDDGFICTRDCTEAPEPRICYYKFVAEQYSSMGPACNNCSNTDYASCYKKQCVQADGTEKTVLTFNRMIPGTMINVCQHDRVIVDVFNKMPARTLTIHWHGLLQWKSPWMDGVPYIAQCPIPDGVKFRYDFEANICGTHFYHSHEGAQILDGLFGAFIIRQPAAIDPQSSSYDFDYPSNTVVINDWNYVPSDAIYPGFNHDQSQPAQAADNYLINGRGAYKGRHMPNGTGTPHTVFRVKSGFRYRFRFISATSFTCAYRATIQDHTMSLIAVDGNPCYSHDVGTLFLVAGDRFDVVVTADRPPGSYNIIVKGEGVCDVPEQVAFLVYDDLPPEPALPYNINTVWTEPILDYVEHSCFMNTSMLCTDHIQSLYPVPRRLLAPEPDMRLFLSASAHRYTNPELFESNSYKRFALPAGGLPNGAGPVADTFNNMSSVLPSSPIQLQPNKLSQNMICPDVCLSNFCTDCIHLIKIPLNAVVEIVLIDDLSSDRVKFFHPQHLHGQHFVLLKQGSRAERQTPEFWRNINITCNPLTRDIVAVPAQGFSVVRFEATNPGFWLFHCHFHFHLEGGMFVVFQVGVPEQFLPPPPNLPKCGDYLPPMSTLPPSPPYGDSYVK